MNHLRAEILTLVTECYFLYHPESDLDQCYFQVFRKKIGFNGR